LLPPSPEDEARKIAEAAERRREVAEAVRAELDALGLTRLISEPEPSGLYGAEHPSPFEGIDDRCGIATIQMQDVAREVCRHFGIKKAELHVNRRSREIVNRRQIAMWLMRELCVHASLPMIGRYFGKDHTTILNAERRVQSWLDGADFDLARHTLALLAKLRAKYLTYHEENGDEQMAGSVNKVILIGNLGADPEVRRLNSGDMVVNIRVATSETWRDKQSGERREKTEWHNVVIFNEGIAKIVEQYAKKGMKCYVEGALQTRKWQDQSGSDRYSTEVVLQKFRGEFTMLQSVGGGDSEGARDGGGQREPSYRQPRDNGGGSSGSDFGRGSGGRSQRDLDDEIPF